MRMNVKRNRVILLALATLLLVTTSSRAEPREFIWGGKPVLPYFALTPSLRADLVSGAGLSETELFLVCQIASQEMDQLLALDQSSQVIAEDSALSLVEKRLQIASMGYNQQVTRIVAEGQLALQSALDVDTYARLNDWMESHWEIERQLHGLQSVEMAGTYGPRTYSVYTTRYETEDYTVAIPDKCPGFANDDHHICDGSGYAVGQNYAVRLTYSDTVTVTVGDSGPWNVDDNFWATLNDPQPRRLFTDLPLGMPEAQAAYYDNYNGGADYLGRTVSAPFGLDLNRDVSIDIGLQPGDNDWVEIVYLWTEGWDDLRADVVTLLEPTTITPDYIGDICTDSWYSLYPLLEEFGTPAYLTLNVDSISQSTNSASWLPDFPSTGEYQVRAFIPDHPSINWPCPAKYIQYDTHDARYTIFHQDGQTTVSVDQMPYANQWVDLGIYSFAADSGGMVTLTDLNGEETLSHTVSFSAIQFRRDLPSIHFTDFLFLPLIGK
jgi:hypothetical protein